MPKKHVDLRIVGDIDDIFVETTSDVEVAKIEEKEEKQKNSLLLKAKNKFMDLSLKIKIATVLVVLTALWAVGGAIKEGNLQGAVDAFKPAMSAIEKILPEEVLESLDAIKDPNAVLNATSTEE